MVDLFGYQVLRRWKMAEISLGIFSVVYGRDVGFFTFEVVALGGLFCSNLSSGRAKAEDLRHDDLCNLEKYLDVMLWLSRFSDTFRSRREHQPVFCIVLGKKAVGLSRIFCIYAANSYTHFFPISVTVQE